MQRRGGLAAARPGHLKTHWHCGRFLLVAASWTWCWTNHALANPAGWTSRDYYPNCSRPCVYTYTAGFPMHVMLIPPTEMGISASYMCLLATTTNVYYHKWWQCKQNYKQTFRPQGAFISVSRYIAKYLTLLVEAGVVFIHPSGFSQISPKRFELGSWHFLTFTKTNLDIFPENSKLIAAPGAVPGHGNLGGDIRKVSVWANIVISIEHNSLHQLSKRRQQWIMRNYVHMLFLCT